MEKKLLIAGIDVGSSDCRAYYHRNIGCESFHSYNQDRKIESRVSVTKAGTIKIDRGNYDNNYVFTGKTFKGLLGVHYDESVTANVGRKCFAEIRATEDNWVEFYCNTLDRAFTPNDLMSAVLRDILMYLYKCNGNDEVGYITFTVPPLFSLDQRKAFEKVIQSCGIDRSQYCFISETIAAAIYSLVEENLTPGTFLVYDLGGGTFGMSIVRVTDKGIVEICSDGDSTIGGDSFDLQIAEFVQESFQTIYDKPLLPPEDHPHYTTSYQKLIDRCKQTKEEMARGEMDSSSIDLQDIHSRRYSKMLSVPFTNEDLDQLVSPGLERTIEVIDRALRTSGLIKQDITGVLLVGGSTRLPSVESILQEYFEREISIHGGYLREHMVATGACMLSKALYQQYDLPFLEYHNQRLFLHKLTQHDIGIGGSDNSYHVVIPQNTPQNGVRFRRRLRKSSDDVEEQYVHVYRGSQEKASDNTFVGTVRWSGFPDYPAEYVYFDLFLSVDEDGRIIADVEDVRTHEMYISREYVK